jgi:hypothetical protein
VIPLNQWVVPQPAVPLTVAARGMSMLAAPTRVAAASKAAVEVGRMVRRGAGTRGQREKRRKVGDTHTLPLLWGGSGHTHGVQVDSRRLANARRCHVAK